MRVRVRAHEGACVCVRMAGACVRMSVRARARVRALERPGRAGRACAWPGRARGGHVASVRMRMMVRAHACAWGVPTCALETVQGGHECSRREWPAGGPAYPRLKAAPRRWAGAS